MKGFTPTLAAVLAIVLISGISIWAVEQGSYQSSSGDLTGAFSMRDLFKKHKSTPVIPPPAPVAPKGPSCGSIGGTQCLNFRAVCKPGLTNLGSTYDCTFMCCGPQKQTTKPTSPSPVTPIIPSQPRPLPTANPQPAQIIPVTPAIAPSCAEVTKGKGICTRYCDREQNSLDVEYSRGNCGGGSNVCCVKGELATLPDTQLTCAGARAKYNAEKSWCAQQKPCVGTLPRYIGQTSDCANCCLETARY